MSHNPAHATEALYRLAPAPTNDLTTVHIA